MPPIISDWLAGRQTGCSLLSIHRIDFPRRIHLHAKVWERRTQVLISVHCVHYSACAVGVLLRVIVCMVMVVCMIMCTAQ